jgi:capsular exopolysaccharide synthesis family protein
LSFFSEYFDHSFKKPEDIQKRLELPVLATIPVGDTVSKLINRKDSKLSLLPENRGDIKLEGYADPAESKKFPMATEKSLLTFPWEGKEAAQIMSITSCYRGEGVSTIAVSLALTLAYQRKGRVLLVDVNFGDPDLHRYFGTEPSPGLAEVLMERHSYMASIRPSSIDNLDLLFTGQNIVDLSPFTDTKAFTDLLGFWKREYSFVIFDSPPLEVGRQALSLGSRVDSVILVIEAEKVRWEVARRAKEHLQKVNANIEGVILNKRRFYIPQWLYRTL